MQRNDTKLALCLAALAVLPYVNALSAAFTLDDEGMILHNPLVQSPHLPLWSLLTTPYLPGHLYRPLTFFSFWCNRWLDSGPWGFHAVNIGLHVTATVLGFRLACRLLPSAGAFVATALFAVHPVHAEAVTSIVGRSEILAAIGVFGALLCAQHARCGESPRWFWLALGGASFVLGLLSKESAFVLLPLLVIIRAASEGASLLTAAKRSAGSAEGILFALLGAAYLGLRLALFGSLTLPEAAEWLDNPLAYTGVPVRLATASVVLADYVRLLLFPWQLSADYSFAQVPLVRAPWDPRLLAAALLAVCATVAVWRTRRWVPVAPAAALFVLAALSLTSNLLFAIGTIEAERLLYLPSFGLCLLAGSIGAAAWSQRRAVATVACAAALALLAGRTWMRNFDWQSNLTLFRAAVVAAPHSAKAHHNLAVALAATGDYDRAALSFRRARALYPEYGEAAFGIGRMYEKRDNTAGALHWYNEAVRLNPHLAKAQLNRGVIYYNRGQYEAAEESFRSGLASAPDDSRLLTGLGLSLLAHGEVGEARSLLQRATRIDADNAEAQRALRLALEATSEARESL